MMKNFFLLIIFTLTIQAYGQNYSFDFYHGNSDVNFTIQSYSGVLKINNSTIDSFSRSGYIEGYTKKTFPAITVPVNSTFYFSITSHGILNLESTSYACDNDNITKSISLDNLITDGFYFDACGMALFAKNLKPNNLTIVNAKSSSEVCSGEELVLQALSDVASDKFPNVAYHWQYSIYDIMIPIVDEEGYVIDEYPEKYWIDVPPEKNNNPIARFSIQELLGSSHKDYFDKQIYFRLGYEQNRAFTSPLAITYSSCAPEIQLVKYTAPDCSGGLIPKIEITFNRPLASDEVLKTIYIQGILNGPISNQRYDVSFDSNNPLKYTFTNIASLENGKKYNIVYQAKKGGVPIGTLTSSDMPFTHVEPDALKYLINSYTQPTCAGGNDGGIEIEVIGGTKPYIFYQDGKVVTPTSVNDKYHLGGLSAKAEGYNIKVTDQKGCIEKN